MEENMNKPGRRPNVLLIVPLVLIAIALSGSVAFASLPTGTEQTAIAPVMQELASTGSGNAQSDVSPLSVGGGSEGITVYKVNSGGSYEPGGTFNDSVTESDPPVAPVSTSTPPPAAGGATATLTPCVGGTTFLNRSITTSDNPLPNRLTQNGVASTCGTSKPFPGSLAATKHYDQYVLTNNAGASRCVTITLNGSACGANKAIIGAAYLGTFNPNNISQNYLADYGQSVNGNNPQGVYSFNIPAGQQMVLIVYDTGTTVGCDNYSLRVDACLTGGAPTSTPTGTSTGTPTGTPCPIQTQVTGSIAASDPTQAGRLTTGTISNCGTAPPCPGVVNSVPRHYDAYTYVNTSGQAQCITVTLDAAGCGGQFMASTSYLGSFNPANLCQNFLGVNNSTFTGSQSYSYNVPAGQTFIVVVYEATPDTFCPSYTLTVRSCGTVGQPATNTPTRTATSVPPTNTPTRTPTSSGATPTLTPCPGGTSFLNRSITVSDTPLPNRLTQNGVASTCSTNKPFPGSLAATKHYDQYVITNSNSSSQCVTVTLTGGACGANKAVMSAAYLGSFNPNNISQNYLADYGQSVNGGNTQGVYSFNIPAGQQMVLIVYDMGTVDGCDNYSLRVDACLTGGVSTSTPTLTATSVPPTNTATHTSTNTPTRTATPVPPSNTPTRTNTVAPTQTAGGPSATAIPTNTNTNTPTRTATTAPTNTATRTSTVAPTQTAGGPSATTAPSNTPVPTNTPTVPPATATATTSVPTSTPCTLSFTDVPSDHTFYSFIRCLACRGIIGGYSDGTFRPGNEITRGQIAKMVSNAANINDDPGHQIFEDVDLANTFFTWINRLANRGFMGGYPCGGPGEPCGPDYKPYFRPFANATRGQLAKIVSNAAGIASIPTGQFYTDVPEDHPFYIWIMRLTTLGVMSGYVCGGPGEPCDDANRPYFRPFANVTRGQASKIVANTFFPNCQTPARQ